jgi:hypothetical protein
MALDASTNQLFVAELANGTVDDLDVRLGKVVHRIGGLHEPQGIAWIPATNELAIACGDGSVRFFKRDRWLEVARISLGDDADNVRIDPANGHLIVGYGAGALALIDPATHKVLGRVPLGGHPEAFEIVGSRIFVNVPTRHSILVVSIADHPSVTKLPTGPHAGNYPMAAKRGGASIAVAFRFPAAVSVFDTSTGKLSFSSETCGDADDLYFLKSSLVVICGRGAVDMVSLDASHTADRVSTASGARTGILSSDGSTLFVAVPARDSDAEIWQLLLRQR